MRDTRVYLSITAAAAAASVVLILSLLALGAEFGANVWPHVRGDDGRGGRVALPAAPRPAARPALSTPARLEVPAPVLVPPRTPVLTPSPRDAGSVFGDRGDPVERRATRRPRRPTRATPPAPAPAPPAIAPAPVPAAPAAQQATTPARSADDDDEPRAGDDDRSANTTPSRNGRGNAFARDLNGAGQQDSARKPKHRTRAAPVLPVAAVQEIDDEGPDVEEDDGNELGADGSGRGKGRWHYRGRSDHADEKAKGRR